MFAGIPDIKAMQRAAYNEYKIQTLAMEVSSLKSKLRSSQLDLEFEKEKYRAMVNIKDKEIAQAKGQIQ